MATDYAEFANWLRAELTERGMIQADLARQAKVDRGYVSRIIRMEQPPSVGFCRSLARAFGIPAAEVFARAGLLPPVRAKTERVSRIVAVIEELSESEQDFLEQFAPPRRMANMRRRNRRHSA